MASWGIEISSVELKALKSLIDEAGDGKAGEAERERRAMLLKEKSSRQKCCTTPEIISALLRRYSFATFRP